MVGAGAVRGLLGRCRLRALIGAISVRTAGIYTIMITLAIAAAFFYFAQQNYSLFNGHSGFAGIAAAGVCGRQLARSDAFYYLCLAVAALCYVGGALLLALDLRARAAGDPRQSAPHARARLRRHRASGRRLFLLAASSPRWPACCWSGSTAGSRRARSTSVEAIDILVIAVIGGMRHPIGPFIGAVVSCPDPDLRHRYRRRRALQYADRACLSGDRVRLAGRSAGPVGQSSSRLLAQESLRSRHSGGSGASSTSTIQHKGGENDFHIDDCFWALGLAAATGGPVALAMAEDTIKVGAARHLRGRVHGARRGQHARRRCMAVDDYGGKVAGKKIEIVKGSSDASPDSAVRAARKLVEQDGVKVVVGPLSGDEGLAVKDYAKTQPDVTFVNGTSAAQDTTLRDPAPNFFRFSTDGAQWMAGLGDYAYNDKGYKNVATVAEDYSFPYTQVFGFMAPFCKAGGHVVEEILGADRQQGLLLGHRRDPRRHRRDLCRARRRRLR